ncbi:hypothetical protein ACTFIW_004466 [Dictyostelium discoideum]
MNNEYNELLFWKVFKNKYLFNYILNNKCCYKSKKFKTITSIDSMLKHKQYQLLICKLKANENLNFKSTYGNDKIINEIKDIELFKEIYSLLLFKGYRGFGDDSILFDHWVWGTKSADLFDIHLKYHPEKLQTYYSTGSIDSIIKYSHPKLIIKVLNYFKESINHNKPFTLTKNERDYFIMEYLCLNENYECDVEEIKEGMKIISNIPISSTSIFTEKRVPSIYRSVNVGWYLKYKKVIPFEFNVIHTSFDCSKGRSMRYLWGRFHKTQYSVHGIDNLSMFSNFCCGFDYIICRYIDDVKGEVKCISTSINSVLLFFKLYYCNYHCESESKSIPTLIQSRIDLIIENVKHRPWSRYQSIKQLFQLLINETESIVLYAFYLKEYNEPIDTFQISKEIQLLLIYYMTKTYNTNILNFLLKKHIKINITKLDLDYIGELYLNILFKSIQIYKKDIIMFYKNYKSQKSIIIEDIDKKPLHDVISANELLNYSNKQLHLILGNESSSKWKEITSNLIDNDMIVTIKDKETIDWLSDIETGGCSILNIRNALNSKLNQMRLDFSTLELLEYARIKFKQVIPILDSNKELCNIHILRTHNDIVSLINRLNRSKFNDNEDIFKYYMIQLIQFGSRNSIKYLIFICDSIDELLIDYEGWGHLEIRVLNYELRRFFISAYLIENETWDDSAGYHENEEFNKYKIPTQQTCQIINLSKIKVNFNHFPNSTSYLFQTFIELLNFEGVQFILDNLNGKDLKLNIGAFKDGYRDRIYTSKYLYKDLIDMIQFLIDKFKDGQLSLSNLSLILNYLFLKLIRVNNLTIDQIKTAHQLISNYIKIDSFKYSSYYYLKTLSPIIGECITIIKDPTYGFEGPRPFCDYHIDTSVYTFEYIFTNRNNNDLNQFIDSTIMDIVKDGFNNQLFKMLYNNNQRINLFLHYFEIKLKRRKTKGIIKPFLPYKLLKLIIKTFDLESFIKLDNLLQQYEINLKRDVVNSEEKDANNLLLREERYMDGKPLSSNMVEWFGRIINKDYSDYPDIINYLFNKYKHQLE